MIIEGEIMKIQQTFLDRLKTFDDFGAFTSELNHELARWKREEKELLFLESLLETQIVDELMETGKKRKALYIVSLVTYIYNLNRKEEPESNKKYSKEKLDQVTFYDDVELYTRIVKKNTMKERLLREAIPEFLVHNIVETSVEQTC